VEQLEKAIADYCQTGTPLVWLLDLTHCSGINGAGNGDGDEVLLPPFTFFATQVRFPRGRQTCFVDIDEETYNIDPSRLRKRSREDKGIIPSTFTDSAQI